MCGMDFEDICHLCVSTVKKCGRFDANSTGLQVIAVNAEGMCVVGDLTDPDSGTEICSNSNLVHAPLDSCISSASMPKMVECLLVLTGFMLVEIFLLALARGCPGDGSENPSHHHRSAPANKTAVVLLYWYNDFFAGLQAWQIAAFYVTTGLKDRWTKMACNFLVAMCIETVIYDGPLKIIRMASDGSNDAYVCFCQVSFLIGMICGFSAIPCAYMADSVLLMGHHSVLMGLYQFAVDFGKNSLIQLGKRMVYGESMKPYEPLVDELTSTLPPMNQPPIQ